VGWIALSDPVKVVEHKSQKSQFFL